MNTNANNNWCNFVSTLIFCSFDTLLILAFRFINLASLEKYISWCSFPAYFGLSLNNKNLFLNKYYQEFICLVKPDSFLRLPACSNENSHFMSGLTSCAFAAHLILASRFFINLASLKRYFLLICCLFWSDIGQ